MIKENLIKEFGGKINHMSCIYLRNGESHLRSLIEKIGKIDTAIEIGTYQGVSASIISEYAEKVYTIDIADMPLRNEIFDYLKINNVKFIKVSSRKVEDETIEKIFLKDKIDLCFIDGEHFNGELEKDFKACKNCNNIIIHDYATSFREVFDFVNNLKGWKKEISDTFVLLIKEKTKKEIIQDFIKPTDKAKEELKKNGINFDEQIKNIEKPKKKRVRKPKSIQN
jgi:hypothetical protein